MVFGAVFFLSGWSRIIVFTTLGLACGPAILILMPVWWLGVWIARCPSISFGQGAWCGVVLFGTVMLIGLIAFWNIDQTVVHFLHNHIPGFWRLNFSQKFATDYLVGLLVTINLVALRGFQRRLSYLLLFLESPIRFLAGYTFSLYLYHYPLVRFVAAYFPNNNNSFVHYGVTMLSILVVALGLGTVTEKRKGLLKRVFADLLAGSKRTSGERCKGDEGARQPDGRSIERAQLHWAAWRAPRRHLP
jgi:hypothetical protein